MNFPASQRIGALAELDVERLFTSWMWSVGRDRIDSGYDFFVEPDRNQYSGSRFLVQVKGTEKAKKGRLVARVSKERLRQYFENPLPVLIVRASPAGLVWIHAQDWCAKNRGRLAGDGEAGVVIPTENRLDDRSAFESALQGICTPAQKRLGSLKGLASARSDFLSGLDPRFRVDVFATGDSERYTISASGDLPPLTHVAFVPEAEDQARDLAERHRDFGVPFEIDVKEFTVTGSPIFEAIGMTARKGRLSFWGQNQKPGNIVLQAGNKFSISAPSVSNAVRIYAGEKGAVLEPDSQTPFAISATLMPEGEVTKGNIALSIRPSVVASRPIREFSEFRQLLAWADSCIEDGSMFVSIDAAGHPALSTSIDDISEYMPTLDWLQLLAKASEVSRFFRSEFRFDVDQLAGRERWAIQATYDLLRGRPVEVPITSVPVTPSTQKLPEFDGTFLISTTIESKIGGQQFVSCAVFLVLRKFELLKDADGQLRELRRREGSSALMYFGEGMDVDEFAKSAGL